MNNNYDFPVGSDTEDAPWNESLSELYDWYEETNVFETDPLDNDD